MPLLPLVLALAVGGSPFPSRLVLRFAPARALPPEIERAAVAEAAAIWSRYGVVLEPFDPRAPARDVVLTVVIDRTRAARSDGAFALGAIRFSDDGTPDRAITVFVDRIAALLNDARMRDLPFDEWPRSFREQAFARAIGRVVAHEIGHYVLRTMDHSTRGLMRPVQRTDELLDWTHARDVLRN